LGVYKLVFSFMAVSKYQTDWAVKWQSQQGNKPRFKLNFPDLTTLHIRGVKPGRDGGAGRGSL